MRGSWPAEGRQSWWRTSTYNELRRMAAHKMADEAKAILMEELKESPTDEDLLKLLRTLNDSSQ